MAGLVPFEDPMSEFYVWVTLLTEAYVDGLIARLARRRYNVGALAESGRDMILPGMGSSLVSLRLAKRFSEPEIERLRALTKPQPPKNDPFVPTQDPGEEDEDEEDDDDDIEEDDDEGETEDLAEVVRAELQEVLSEMSAKYHSIVVYDVEGHSFDWEASNMPLSSVPPAVASLLSDKDEFT